MRYSTKSIQSVLARTLRGPSFLSAFGSFLGIAACAFQLQAQAPCNAPSPVVANPTAVCIGGTTDLNAISTGNVIYWYTVPTMGTSIGTSASGANFQVSLSTATTYYAEAVGVSGGSQVFSYTGGVQTFTVPSGITSISVDMYGGEGFGAEGYGGRVQATHPVTPGEILQVYVGGAGTLTLGGFNGGGNTGTNSGYGGGGGASDIRRGGTTLTDRILVAGGGGGAGSNCGLNTAEGGQGGGLIGGSGCVYSCSDCQYTGAGGTQSAGGIAGPTGHGSCGGNTNGSLGQGGGNLGGYGTGGGGGYYGGGSGCFEGAGGGSSYTSPLASNVIHNQGVRVGNGVVTISWTGVGCTASARTPVTVTIDGTGPAITCPSNMTMTASTGNCAEIVTYTPPVGTDNCPNPTTGQTSGLPSGGIYPVGTTTNVFAVTDASGLMDSCSFTVTIQDAEAPAITCPANVTANTDQGSCLATVSYTTPVGTDNCSNPVTAQTSGLATGMMYPIGITTNTFETTDASGNMSSCTFTVEVADLEAPAAVCENITIYLDQTGNGAITAGDVDGGSTDNCSIASISASPTTFGLTEVGANNVIFTVTDSSGNSSTCTAVVSVVDSFAVGLQDPSLDNITFSIAPNPTSGLLQVTIACPSCMQGAPMELQLWSITGQMLLRKQLDSGLVNQNANFDLTQFAAGNYMLNLVYDGKTLLRRVMKY